MIESTMISQPASIIMSDSTKVAATSMFVNSPETHLYGVLSVPLVYQSLSQTFFRASTSPYTSPLSSSSRMSSGTSLMRISQPI